MKSYVIKNNKDNSNSSFFDAHLLLTLDSFKKNDYEKANFHLKKEKIKR